MTHEVLEEPGSRQARDSLQGAGLLEQVRRPRDDLEPLLSAQLLQRVLVEAEHHVVAPAHDEEGRRSHRAQIGPYVWQADYPGASAFLWQLFSCHGFIPGDPQQTNVSEFCDRTSDRLMRRALAATDSSGADRLWARAERRIVNQAPPVPLDNPGWVNVASRRVGGYEYNPQWGVLLDQLWVR